MSRAAVRTAVAEYLSGGGLPFVGQVLRARPKGFKPMAGIPVGQKSGAVIIVHLARSVETRAALGGPTSGEKYNDHTVALEILFSSNQLKAIAAQDDHDALIDALMNRLRADRNLGAPTVIWQCPDRTGYELQLAEPVTDKGTTIINAVLTMIAKEYVQA